MAVRLSPTHTPGAQVLEQASEVWRLEIPTGPRGRYRLAQLDDYSSRKRAAFPWDAPFHFDLRARASHHSIPGTWGFGLWNDPFGMALLTGAEAIRLPALPNAAWFFHATPPNYLSLRDDLPARGWLASTFRSPRIPSLAIAPAVLAAPLAILPPGRRLLRRWARMLVHQDAVLLNIDPTEWQHYRLEWRADHVGVWVNDRLVLETNESPAGPLGMVIWVDNQYAAFTPEGHLAFGTLANDEPVFIEIQNLRVGPL